MFINIFIYAAAAFLFGVDRAMYSVLVYFITYKVIDIVLEGLNESKSVNIISDKSEAIGQSLIAKLDVGVTYIEGVGGYSGIPKKIIYCVVSRLEMAKLKDVVKQIDPYAFIAVENVHEVESVRIKEKKINNKKKHSLTKKIKKFLKNPKKYI